MPGSVSILHHDSEIRDVLRCRIAAALLLDAARTLVDTLDAAPLSSRCAALTPRDACQLETAVERVASLSWLLRRAS